MAAYIDIKEPGHPKFSVTWHVGQPFKYNPYHIVSATVDGDEQFLIPYPNRVHTITGTEAMLYGCYIKDAFADCKEPVITEEGVYTLLKGHSNPTAN